MRRWAAYAAMYVALLAGVMLVARAEQRHAHAGDWPEAWVARTREAEADADRMRRALVHLRHELARDVRRGWDLEDLTDAERQALVVLVKRDAHPVVPGDDQRHPVVGDYLRVVDAALAKQPCISVFDSGGGQHPLCSEASR